MSVESCNVRAQFGSMWFVLAEIDGPSFHVLVLGMKFGLGVLQGRKFGVELGFGHAAFCYRPESLAASFARTTSGGPGLRGPVASRQAVN
jgi:hypothetical protein